jgi:hypothetical protein
VVVASEGNIAGGFALADTARVSVPAAVAELRRVRLRARRPQAPTSRSSPPTILVARTWPWCNALSGSPTPPYAPSAGNMCWAFGSTIAAQLLTALGVLNPAHPQRRDGSLFYTNPQQTFLNITRATAQILEAGAIPVVLGGDHAVSYGVVRAFEDPLCVVHFDAHLD